MTALGLFAVAGLLIGVFYAQHAWASDAEAYWQAAMRLRSGEALYPAWEAPNLSVVYRYTPWFAWAWVPATFAPKELVMVTWTLLLVGATAAVSQALRSAALVLVPALLGAAWIGNVHPILIAGLVLSIRRGYGWVGIALAASLKATPLLLVLYYVGRREWSSLWKALGLTVVLVAPALLYDLSGYVTEPARTISLYALSPVVWGVVAVASWMCAVRLAATRYGWLAASVSVLASLPRMLFYDLAYLAVPLGVQGPEARSVQGRNGRSAGAQRDQVIGETGGPFR